MKKTVFTFIICLIAFIVLELFSFTGLELIRRKKHFVYLPKSQNIFKPLQEQRIQKLLNKSEKYISYDSVLGWTIKPNGKNSTYKANVQGIRHENKIEKIQPMGKIRISTYGDSYVHCDEVKNDQTWQHHLNTLIPNLEVVNFGVSGYGTDQSYLRYLRNSSKYHSNIVIIGFMSENPRRNVNTFRPFYKYRTQMPLSKPRYKFEDNKLTLIDNPIPNLNEYKQLLTNQKFVLMKLAEHDYYYQSLRIDNPLDFLNTIQLYEVLKSLYVGRKNKIVKNSIYNTKSEAYKITSEILSEFEKTVRHSGSKPLIVIFPHRTDLEKLIENKNSKNIYSPYIDYFIDKKFDYIDLADYFVNDPNIKNLDDIYERGGHFSNEGNKYIAQYLQSYLTEQNFISTTIKN